MQEKESMDFIINLITRIKLFFFCAIVLFLFSSTGLNGFCCFVATFVFKLLWVSGVGGGGRGGGKIFSCTCCHASATVAAIVTASVFIGVYGGSGSRTVECAQDFMVEGGV
jgi:hypothetical protein